MSASRAAALASRVLPLAALLLAVALLLFAVGEAAADHGRKRDVLERSLRAEASEQAEKLNNYFNRARSLTLVTANNPAYREFYKLDGSREEKILAGGPVVRDAERGLAYLEDLFPGAIGEACFIDRSGAENARAVKGRVEGFRNLSLEEAKAPFFKPTFALVAGEVYQAEPYLSPDTNEWVVSNSTPLPAKDGVSPAILHFEVTIESFRREAAEANDRFDIAIVEANSGQVIADTRFPQAPGSDSRLGRPEDVRFTRFFSTLGRAFEDGTADVSGRPSAFHNLKHQENNANQWVVVASASASGASWVEELGAPDLAMMVFALLLLAFAVLNFRAAQAKLQAAATSDSLTGLGNRRKLISDLDALLQGATPEHPVLLGLFDLDGFKSYNDSYGHPAGDSLLVRVSARLDAAVKGRGKAYRMGGDEFCLLAPVAPGDEDAVLEAASAALSEHGEGFAISASFGAVLLPLEADEGSDALLLADQRMYSQKSGGRASAGRQTTDALMRVVAERYPDLGEHLGEVTALCAGVADALELAEDDRVPLLQAASLHDIGKAGVPDDIVFKPGPLTADEWVFMRQHTVIGERILAAAPALAGAAQLVRWSHERVDGSGYPDGLSGEEIPLGARIIAVCDAFDAMTSRRPYRPTPMSVEGALAELRRSAGSHFDPAVVEIFARVLASAPNGTVSHAA
jgi:diguanylate cyclase (GGDEF)-like protein